MKKRIIIIISSTFFSFLFITSFAQDNAVKLSIGSLFFSNINLSYERVISSNQSVAMGFGVLLEREFPEDFISNSVATTILKENQISGLSSTLEYRFYTGRKDAPNGFYVGLYIKCSKYDYKFWDVFADKETSISGDLSTIGAGFQLGVHWLIKDRISIDWYFLGLGITNYKIGATFETELPGINYAEFAEDIDSGLSDIPFFGDKIKTRASADNVAATANFLFPGFRTGISIGIVF